MYCGNNALRVVSDKDLNYKCLQKGIIISKKNTKYPLEVYIPKHKTEKIYCGKKDVIPNDYTRNGTPVECLRKGFGVGKKINFQKELKTLISDIENLLK